MAGTLYLVSTPIGNLGDLTVRAAEVLRDVDAVLCEDTRHSRRLLDHVGSKVPAFAYHEHNEARATPGLVARLAAGERLALVSDAGTPLLSDPGARLVRAAADAGVPIVPVPGASALLAALVVSGLDATRFTFYGFLARKGRERKEALHELSALGHTAVLYEAPARVADTLAELAAACGEGRPAVVARELTKQFEEVRRGTLGELAAYYAGAAVRGEVVVLLGGRPASADAADPEAVRARARTLHAGGASSRDVARALADEFGLSRNDAYRLASEGRGDITASESETA
ncbi:16S rRNA (cytidine(1402)-2'-O)-methyltransferase [Roseisolibacter sp. H3M3-2]|uniref:16S rRNA (cytidine(1402)-2'-O)-methyltransferase n=1 Tax=Roseisolibacter sp. H3M3-2 TaxID=3031323 RepID=UPI0023DB62CD|nr:16S rRNA (cytidine(1402)-2'-O)-methyltransferase [Roseisolibacter sp. H3M3-2]MDF1505570.1 16S rRNA (cytidine(1402)-2'-O)-methyltransferase [Roseisolibacter sp. H3M3-2]